MNHTIWLYLWFYVGMFLYIMKRAYYLVTGPNPIASSYGEFFSRCWIPLLFRAAINGGIFAATFNAQLVAKGLTLMGWSNWADAVGLITQFAPVAFFFGVTSDVFTDMAISKIGWLKEFLPQMPGPIPTPVPTPEQRAVIDGEVKK